MVQHKGDEKTEASGGRTLVVGVKLDSRSNELLTWALVKVAETGDTVVALHVLRKNDINREVRSSLLSIVNAFDSVLAVYEGFCNLKQVDLKLKVCRGSSIRKIIVREAKSRGAEYVILGSGRDTILSSTSVARYCAKKLPKDCSVLAVNNGKVALQKQGSAAYISFGNGNEDLRRNGLLSTLSRSMSLNKNCKVLSEDHLKDAANCDEVIDQSLEQLLLEARSATDAKQNCSVCGAASNVYVTDNPCNQCVEGSCGSYNKDSKVNALVPAPNVEVPSSSESWSVRQFPELKPGWPLLRRSSLTTQKFSARKISVVQWALTLPSRETPSSTIGLDSQQTCSNEAEGESHATDPVDTEITSVSASAESTLPKELEGLQQKFSATCVLFNYQELLSATSNLSSENLIGKGGSSLVYKGYLFDGKEVAVKILKPSEEMLKDFALELEIMTALHHKNIVSLLGFCLEENNLLLVYDFVSRGSLEENLHGKEDSQTFGWSERFKVAIGIAEALEYLHTGSDRAVIHRDVKSSNILLSDEFEPQLSDFGFAKWASNSSSYIVCTDVAGTFGYLAPEYFMYGKVNEKVDVYAYGVVLLELLSGRKPISSDHQKGQESLVMWAMPILNGGKVTQLLDSSLGDDYNPEQMERMATAAKLCIRRSPRARPKMSVVLKLLRGDTEVTNWARQQVNNSLEESEMLDDDNKYLRNNLQSHFNLALLDVEDDSLSISSMDQIVSFEEYYKRRCSHSSSFEQ